MTDYEVQNETINEKVFKGKSGERLTLTQNHLMFENAKEILLIRIENIVGILCEKKGKYCRIKIGINQNVDLETLAADKYLIVLKMEEAKQLIEALKSVRS